MDYKEEHIDTENCIRKSIQTEGLINKTFCISKTLEKDIDGFACHSIVLLLIENKNNESMVLPLAHYTGEITIEILNEEKKLMMKFNRILYSELSKLMN